MRPKVNVTTLLLEGGERRPVHPGAVRSPSCVQFLDAQRQARAAFGKGSIDDMPTIEVDKSIDFVADLLVSCSLAKSRGEAKRLIEGGGVSIEEIKFNDAFAKIPEDIKAKGEFILHKGKKVHIKVVLK